ncbi:MAG: three-helix bundle dimerization domain-containing protein [Chloroflexota bacterium]
MQDQESQAALHTIEGRLFEEFGDRVSLTEIMNRTQASFHRFDTARIRTFIPIFVHREVRDQLRYH